MASLIDALQPNILVDVSGNARITDFCFAQDTLGRLIMPERWSTRWTAPEILGESGTPSTKADVFSFGMVMVEVCSNKPTIIRPPQVNSLLLHSGTRPLLARFRSVAIILRRR